MGWAAAIPAGIGLLGSVLGGGKGKKVEYAPQAPQYQQNFAQDYYKMLQGLAGQAGTPYGGPLTASAMNPFTQSALSMWSQSPYAANMGMNQIIGGQGGMPGFGTYADYMGGMPGGAQFGGAKTQKASQALADSKGGQKLLGTGGGSPKKKNLAR